MIVSFPPKAARSDRSRASVDQAVPRSSSLWEMQRDDMQLTSSLVWTRGQWEIWLFGHELITWRPFVEPRDAVAWANLVHQDLERDDWQ